MNTSKSRKAKDQKRVRRAIRVQVRTDAIEYGAWCIEADKEGLNFSGWARSRLNGALRAVDQTEKRELVRLRELVVYTLQLHEDLRRQLASSNAPAWAQVLAYLQLEWSRRALAGASMEAETNASLEP